MLLICYPKCTTCKKAEKFLKAHAVDYTYRDIKIDHPTKAELESWLKQSGLPSKNFFNTSGQLYRSMQLKDKLKTMDDVERIALLSTDGMLVKRPILIGDDFVLVGFKEENWFKALNL